MKFGFIAKHRGIWAVDWMCGALGVSRGGFYAWLARPRSRRSRSDEEVGAKVRASFIASDRTYGARRVWHDMLAAGISCGLHRIERLMRLQAFKARPRRRRLPPDLGERQVAAVAANVLDRSFEAPAPNRKWIADFTYVWTAEGWLYVAAVIDLFSRRVVGWSMSAEMMAQLVTDALVMAIWRRGKPDALLHHSDRGSQYTSEQFQKLLADHGIICSMSRSGNVWDNAAMESFFSSLDGKIHGPLGSSNLVQPLSRRRTSIDEKRKEIKSSPAKTTGLDSGERLRVSIFIQTPLVRRSKVYTNVSSPAEENLMSLQHRTDQVIHADPQTLFCAEFSQPMRIAMATSTQKRTKRAPTRAPAVIHKRSMSAGKRSNR